MRRRLLALPALLLLLVPLGVAHSAGAATPAVRLLAGTTPATTVFPNDAFTLPDAAQQTGRRVSLPVGGCDAQGRSLCDDLALLNTLDGFDLQPRVTLPFDGPVDLLSVTPSTVYVEDAAGTRSGLVQLVVDPATSVVSGTTDLLLAPRSTYTLVVTNGVRDLSGAPVDVCGTGCGARRTAFTTMTSTNVLDRARQALDDGTAYSAAGIPAAQTVDFTKTTSDGRPAILRPGSGAMITRGDQTSADPAKPLTTSSAINTAQAASIGFGSILSPQYVDGQGAIAQVPTSQAPPVRGSARIGVTMAAGAASPLSCLKPVVFGPGFTRSKYDLFLAGDALPAQGVAAFATDPLGHSYGPASTFTVTTSTRTTLTGSGFGRGKDLDGDGLIGNSEGVGPTYRVARQADGSVVPDQPSPQALVGLRDGLIQTVVDDMTLVRALEKGADVDGDGTVDTCTGKGSVSYFGQSFGGIYGTMLLGTDPDVTVAVLNVPGGPIVDIARESAFRGNLAAQLQANKPSLLNGGPGLNRFTESLPLRRDPRVTAPAAGSAAVREYLARGNWVERPGSPETYAPRLGAAGTAAAKKVLFQTAYTDGTVPNPTAGTLYRAGGLYGKVWIYRNDRTPTANTNPHGFLLDPTLAGRNQGQQQVQDWLTSGGTRETDPDAAGPEWEKASLPGSTGTDYVAQLDCLHYPDPQTGATQVRTPNSPDCADLSGTLAAPQVVPSTAPATTSPSATGTASVRPTPSASPSPRPTSSPSEAAAAKPSLTVSPAIITAGERADVEVTAQPGAQVRLFAYTRPNSTYVQVREGVADTLGHARFSVAPASNTRMLVRSTDPATRVTAPDSDSVVLMVRTSINLVVARTGTRTYRLSGSTLPKRVGQTVNVYYRSGTREVLALKARVTADGRYQATRRFGTTGRLTLSTRTGSDITNVSGSSRQVVVLVR